MDIVSSDIGITTEMRKDAENLITELIVNKEIINEAEVSQKIKEFFDDKYEPNWHCIIGTNFQVSFSHEENTFISVKVGQITIVLFKIG